MSSMLPPIYQGGTIATPGQGNANTSPYISVRPPLRDAASGQGTQSVGDKAKIFNMSPRARQAYLRSMGFNVKVDGQSGPLTASAAWSYVHGHNASWFNNQSRDWQQSIWNQHFAQFHKPVKGDVAGAAPPAGSGKVPGNDNNRVPADAGNSQFSGSPSVSALGSDIGVGIAGLYKLAQSGTLANSHLADTLGTMENPHAAGAAAAEAQYGAQLRAQQAAVDRLPAQGKQNEADLKSWYQKIADQQRGSATADATMADSLIGDSQGASAGVINALGGAANPSAGDLGAAGENETAALRALKLAGAIGSSDIGSAIGAEGLSARMRQRNLDTQAQTDAANQLYDTQKASGAASTLATADATGRNNALDQARLQARLGIISQNNSVVDSRANRLAGALSAEEGAAALGPTLDYKSAEAQAALARARAATNAPVKPSSLPKGAWVNLNGTQRNKLAGDAHTTITSMIQSKASTADIVSRTVNIYRAQGLHPAKNPDVAQAIVGVLQASGIKVDPTWAIAQWAGLGKRK